MKCVSCNERTGTTRCEGCQTLFCLPCMNKHRKELLQQLQHLMDSRSAVKDALDTAVSTLQNEKTVPCMIVINQWEQDTIQRIKQTADRARKNIHEIMAKSVSEIRRQFEILSTEMQQRQKEENHLESDINNMKNQLEKLKNEIKHVNKKITVDTTASNGIQWNSLINLLTEERSTATPSGSSIVSEIPIIPVKATVAPDTSHGTDNANRSTKKSEPVQPYYFSSFQSYCTDLKSNTPTKSTKKDQLPIPELIRNDADTLLSFLNEVIIERLIELTHYTTSVPVDFIRQEDNPLLHRYFIDRAMLRTMENAKVINYMTSLKKLYPVRTSGNGNCLLHAVLIAMAGVHDFNLYLRDRLTQFMDANQKMLKEQWRIHRLKSDKNYGIKSEDSELDSEWQELCDLVRYENSEDGSAATSCHFLEAVHIFSISNMLHRPIIVLSEDVVRNKHGEAISVNDLLGIYLPILLPAGDCVREPIVLAFDRSHFCPLQTCDDEYGHSPRSGRKFQLDNLLPLYQSLDQTYDQNILPVHFLGNDVTKKETMKYLHDYFQIKKVLIRDESGLMDVPVFCARLGEKRLASNDNFFMLYRKYILDFMKQKKEKYKEDEDEDLREVIRI